VVSESTARGSRVKTSCSTWHFVPLVVAAVVAVRSTQSKASIPLKCALVPFADLQPFVDGLGYENRAVGCDAAADLAGFDS